LPIVPLGAVLVVAVAVAALVAGPPWPGVAQVVAASAMTASFLVAAAGSRPPWRRAWRLLGGWGVAAAAGATLQAVPEPVPEGVIAACYAGGAIAGLAGLDVILDVLYRGGGRGRAFLDGWLYVGSLLAIALGLLVVPAVPREQLSEPAVLAGLGFVAIDLMVVALLGGVALGTAGGVRRRARLAAAGMAVFALSDAVGVADALGRSQPEQAATLAGTVAYGVLALVPLVGAEGGRVAARRPLSVAEATAPYGAAFLALAVVTAWAAFVAPVGPGIFALYVSLFAALVVRQAVTVRDNQRLLRELAEREDHFRSLVLGSTDVILVVDDAGCIDYVSPAVSHVLGHDPESLLGMELELLLHPQDVTRVGDAAQQVLRDRGGSVRVPVRFAARDGGWRDTEATFSHRGPELVVNVRDVSEQRLLGAELERLAFHDPLTGLVNRARFMARVQASLRRRQTHGEHVAVAFLDLDGFKAVNDTAGHDAGDELLVEVAERLHRSVEPGDVVARWGGDEFAILVERRPDPSDVTYLADRVVDALGRPYRAGDREYALGASLGVALAGSGGDDAAALLRNADIAMYRAKQLGKGRVELFQEHLLQTAVARVDVESRLVRALEDRSLGLRYQPIVDLTTGGPVSLEALVRWTDADGRPGVADELIRVAEESGRIEDLGRFVLDRALAQAASWRAAGLPADIAVNLSARQVTAPGLVPSLVAVLSRTGLPASSLTVEITETVLVEGVEAAIERLTTLRRLGVRLVLDDFGTGYSSLAYLSGLPVDGLKLDRAFVSRLGQDPGAHVLVGGVLRMARELGLDVTAEGVETPTQASILLTLGCDRAQGFLFSPPVVAEDVPRLLARRVLAPAAPVRPPVSDGETTERPA
jgi:diguanylate cyclase (GGDEF)-like protein/PAS domain S-box-containing protein